MKKTLKDYKDGKISLNEVLEKIKLLPYEDLGFAKIDTHRVVRKGYIETIFCKSKTTEHIIEIIKKMVKNNHNVLATKADKKIYNEVKKIFPKAQYNEYAKTIVLKNQKVKKKKEKFWC